MTKSNLKICVVSISLAKGGAERSTAILTKMLQDEAYQVHLVLLTDAIDYEFEGHLFNLGLDKSLPDNQWKRFKRIRKLRQYFITEKFDYIIDNRARQSALVELLYLNYVYRSFKFMYVVRSHNLEKYLTKYDWVTKLIIKRTYKIIGVSKDITNTINSKFNTDKAISIYNPLEMFTETNESFYTNKKYILFLGRFDEDAKNFSLLIEAYQQSKLADNSVSLYLVGDGPDKELIQQKIHSYQLQEHIKLFSFTPNVYPILKNSLFLVLTSKYEGFPRVLIEALSVGTPVISVDCQSGPSEIIQHKTNGLLVENHNPEALAEAFDSFLFDIDLYNFCKSNSKQSVLQLNQKDIAAQWSKILIP